MDFTFDKTAEQPDAIRSSWTKDRLRADVHRAVGGYLNLIREVARISERMDTQLKAGSTVTAERMLKRAQFLSYELELHLDNNQLRHASEFDRLAALNEFFFERKQFRVETDELEAYRLDRLIAKRSGAPLILELLYAYLAERIGIQLEFVDLKPDRCARYILRWTENGVARFLDVARRGAWLSGDQLIETLRSRMCDAESATDTALNTCTFETYIYDYLVALRDRIDRGHEPEKLLFLQDTLIAYQPSNLQLVGERALLHRRLGNFKQSLADLKRYFAFHERSRSPSDLVMLYEELVELLEHSPSPTC